MLVLLCAALLMISDGLAWLFRGNTTETGYYVARIANFCSYFFGFLIMPLAAQYVAHLIYTRSNGVRLYWEIYEWGIFIAGAALLILNEFVPYIYTIDETNTFQRMPYFFWIPGFIAFVGVVITLGVAIDYSKYMSPLENTVIILFLSLPIISIILQIFISDVSFVNLAVVISTVILFVSYESHFAQYLVDKEKQVNKAKMRMINRQMHPHFVFNSLALIRHQCLTDPEKAAETINEFSAYLRSTTNLLAESECISFEKELEVVRYYISIHQKRFDKTLNVQYDIRDTEFDVPPFSVQTLVENALHHGINDGQLEGGLVVISTEKIKNKHIVTVEDNGNGFDPAILDQKNNQHTGINNTRERVAAMCSGTLDSLLDDRSDTFKKYRLISFAAPAIFILMYVVLFLIADISLMWKILGAVMTFFVALSSYFNLKHLIFPDVDFGVVKCLRPYNLLVLIYSLSIFLECVAMSRNNALMTLICCIVTGVVSAAMMPLTVRGLKKWRT